MPDKHDPERPDPGHPEPDRPDPEGPDALTPTQDEAVRRLLADARHRDPIPGDVAARLDDVLASLVAERGTAGAGADLGANGGTDRDGDQAPESATGASRPDTLEPLRGEGGPGGAPVIDLGRVRRRRMTQLLVAAATVVVAGVGITAVLGQQGDGSGSDESSGGYAQAPDSAPERGPGSGVPSLGDDKSLEALDLSTPVALRPATVRSKVDQIAAAPRQTTTDAAQPRCSVADPGRPGVMEYAVTWRGADGVLVVESFGDPMREATLYTCGPLELVRSFPLR